jgi:hypothetical protein
MVKKREAQSKVVGMLFGGDARRRRGHESAPQDIVVVFVPTLRTRCM